MKNELKWLMNRYEKTSDRYIEAEKFIMEIAKMNWFQRTFLLPKKLLKFITSREKYKF